MVVVVVAAWRTWRQCSVRESEGNHRRGEINSEGMVDFFSNFDVFFSLYFNISNESCKGKPLVFLTVHVELKSLCYRVIVASAFYTGMHQRRSVSLW